MRAVSFRDNAVEIAEIDDPTPGHRQVLVEVTSAGLNAGDLLQRAGFYPPPPGAPDTPGLEMAGRVVEVGPGCLDTAVGDQVMAVVQGGGQAERCVADEQLLMTVPAGLDLDVAGGFPEVFATAHDALFTQAGLGVGERVCVHGGAGGVGTAAVQLAVAAGADVTATVRNPAHHTAVAALGATVIDPAAMGDQEPFDVILELVGAPNWEANMAAIATEGRIVVIGVGAGSRVEVDFLPLMVKRVSLSASTLRARPLAQRSTVAKRVSRHVGPLVAVGTIEVPVSASFDLDDAASAYDAFEAGGKLGKILLTTGSRRTD